MGKSGHPLGANAIVAKVQDAETRGTTSLEHAAEHHQTLVGDVIIRKAQAPEALEQLLACRQSDDPFITNAIAGKVQGMELA